MATLHWALRAHLKDLREDGRLAVLTALILHANMRNRCWVSTDLLAVETGWSRTPVVHAKQWLAEHGAFILVPFRKRVDEEKKLPRRQHVYQLTGAMQFGDEIVSYLFMTPEAEAAIKAVIAELPESIATKSIATKSSVAKSLLAKPKGSSLLKGNSILEGNATPKGASPRSRKNEPKVYDDVPKHDRLLIIKAWSEALPIPPINAAGQEKNHVTAAEIFREGYRDGQVKRYVKAQMDDGFWIGKTLTLQRVAEAMPAWLVSQPSTTDQKSSPPAAAPAPPRQRAPGLELDED